MTTQQVTERNEAVLSLISDLAKSPENAAQLALEFVRQKVESGDLSREALKELRDAILDTTDLNAEKQAFLDRYGIKALAESQVALVIPKGVSRIQFLQEAQALVREQDERDLVWPDRLKSWAGDRAFTNTTTETLKLAVDGNVKGSTNHTRRQQEEKGWNNVEIQDLAVAHVAYFIATGKDLFAGNIVRARGGALNFISNGLDGGYSYDDRSYTFVSASRAMPFPN
ncbi:MAG: hypothetical protein DCC75_00665 [Proteobacteria bacterium]|nr:MAG: hypothetical protein DCC75_00665 [Pseudomonadota bacterium]